jgi:hypothetical protein
MASAAATGTLSGWAFGSPATKREIDVPIRVKGCHWGGFRTAYRL